LLWYLCVAVGIPLEDWLRCLCRWSLDPLDGALALVSSEFLPLGRSVFSWSCANGVFHILWVLIDVPILFYLNTIRVMHNLKKSLVNRRAHCIFLLWRIWLVEVGMVTYCRRFALHPPDACYPTPAQMIVTYGYVGASLRCPRAPMICSVSVGGAHDFLTDTFHSEVPCSLVLIVKN
jgi:hypothetical protein